MTSSKNPWGRDMISYMEAAAMFGLRHGISNKIMVSTVVSKCHQEAWELLPPAGGLGCPPTHGGAGLKPVLHYCDFYSTCHEGVRKNPGYYFGKFEFSAKHGGKWGRIDPFRCAIESTADRRVERVASVCRCAASPASVPLDEKELWATVYNDRRAPLPPSRAHACDLSLCAVRRSRAASAPARRLHRAGGAPPQRRLPPLLGRRVPSERVAGRRVVRRVTTTVLTREVRQNRSEY